MKILLLLLLLFFSHSEASRIVLRHREDVGYVVNPYSYRGYDGATDQFWTIETTLTGYHTLVKFKNFQLAPNASLVIKNKNEEEDVFQGSLDSGTEKLYWIQDILNISFHGNKTTLLSFFSLEIYPKIPVRLVSKDGGDCNMGYGNVEVKIGKDWGAICDHIWDLRHAAVVCASFGYDASRAIAYSGSHFGVPSDGVRIQLDNVRCTGTERGLELCSHSGFSVTDDCNVTAETAGVDCWRNYERSSANSLLLDTILTIAALLLREIT